MSFIIFKNSRIISSLHINTIIILLLFIKSIVSKGRIRTSYNFGNKQTPEIDKSYNHVLGRNVYFVTEEPEKSMYITAIYPSLTLEVKLKIYTDSTALIEAFNNGKKIYFGFDLLIDNTDISVENYNNYHTDIMVCVFDKTDVDCHDYVDNIEKEEYELNDGGVILNNNLIPLGFSNIDLNFIQENVVDYKNYFSVTFEKEYPPLFDNITMFNWINYVASDTGDGVIGFYGVVEDGMDLKTIPHDKPLYLQKQDFIDGNGLPDNNSLFIKKSNIFFFIFFIFFILS